MIALPQFSGPDYLGAWNRLVGDEQVGYLHARGEDSTRDYREQIGGQGGEPGASGLQVRRSNRLDTLPPFFPFKQEHSSTLMFKEKFYDSLKFSKL